MTESDEASASEDVTAALLAREPLFHRVGHGTGRAEFAAMTAPDFWEVGASGRVHTRQHVLDVLEQRHAGPPVDERWTVSEPRCRDLGAGCYLFTYLLDLDGRRTRRATLWQRAADGTWTAVYHQGTPVT